MKQVTKAPVGFLYLFRGLKLILSDWRLVRLSLLPLMVNVMIFTAFFFSFNYFAYEIVGWVFDQGNQEWYWYILSWLAGAILFVVSLLVVVFGFVIVGLIIAAPFNDMLSVAVEEKITGKRQEAKMSVWELITYIMKNEIKKMSIIIAIQLLIMLLNLIPVVGQAIFVVVDPIFLMMVVAFEFTSYILDRRGFGFSDKRNFIMGRLPLSMGFGFSIWITLMIPVVNFLLLPCAVAGGTMLVIEYPPEVGPDPPPEESME